MIRLLRWLLVLAFPAAAAWAADPAPAQTSPQPQATTAQNQSVALSAGATKSEALPQNQAALNLLKEVEELKAEVARLRGQAEMQAHQIDSLGKRQSDLYVDLDKRLEDIGKQVKTNAQAVASAVSPSVAVANAVASSSASESASKQAASAATGDPLAESKSYEAALNLFRAGNYTKSIASFAAFLKSYPDSTLAPNAMYWTGYAYYAAKDYKNALTQQMKLVKEYPQSAKVPDALLNIASNQMELNDLTSAKKNLEELAAKYPGTNAAAIASKRLDLLK